MKKLLFALALGTGLFAASAANAQNTTTNTGKKTAVTATTPAAQASAAPEQKTHHGKAHKHKDEKANTASTRKQSADRPRDEKGRFMKKEQGEHKASEQPRDEKGRFMKKNDKDTTPAEKPAKPEPVPAPKH